MNKVLLHCNEIIVEAPWLKNLHLPSPFVPALIMAAGAYLLLPPREGALLTLLMVAAAAVSRPQSRAKQSGTDLDFEQGLDNLPDGALVCDGMGTVTVSNRMAESLLGQPRGSLATKTLRQLLPDAPAQCLDTPGSRRDCCSGTPLPCPGCTVPLNKEGHETAYVQLRLSQLPGSGPARHLCLLRDITVSKQAEQSRACSEQVLNRILEALPVGIWVTDTQGHVLFDNPSGRAIWQDSEPGSRLEPEAWWPLDREDADTSGKAGPAIGMYQFLAKDGQHKKIACVRTPFVDRDAQETSIIVQQDVSDFYRVQEDVRLTDGMLDRLLQSLAIGVVIADTRRKIITANDSLCQLLGYDESDLLGVSLDTLLNPADAAVQQGVWEKMDAGETSYLQAEVRCRSRSGEDRWALLHASVVRDGNGVPVYLVGQIVDIHARKLAEKSLAVREHLFTVAQRVARLGYWEWQPEEDRFRCSQEAGKILGLCPATATTLESLQQAVHWEDSALLQRRLKQLAENGKDFDLDCRLRMVGENGRPRIVKIRCTQLSPQVATAHYVGTVIDITDQQDTLRQLWESRDSLRLLSARQEKLLEQERKRIAMELHDELGQLLSGIKMSNAVLHLRYADHPMIVRQAMHTEELADKAIGVVRQVASNLRPLVLDMGLIPALSWQARNFHRVFGIPCEIFADQEPPARDERVDVTVFRVVQEALTNVSRHAAASRVEIHLKVSPDRLQVQIKDDGNGFNPDALIPGKTLGLLGQRERMHSLGGTIEFESVPGTGTSVILTIPTHPSPSFTRP